MFHIDFFINNMFLYTVGCTAIFFIKLKNKFFEHIFLNFTKHFIKKSMEKSLYGYLVEINNIISFLHEPKNGFPKKFFHFNMIIP